jgi:hypothetical protein
LASDWIPVSGDPAHMTNQFTTVVTKSIAESITLPAAEKMSVRQHDTCLLVSPSIFEGHYLCSFRN